MAAASLLVTLPVLIMTVFVQRHIVTGLAAGGIKGSIRPLTASVDPRRRGVEAAS